MDGLVTQGALSHAGSHGLREYRLLVYPDAPVYNKIMAVKQRFFQNYGIEEAVHAFPHIMVAGFYASEGMEETLIRWMQRICSRITSFVVNLNNLLSCNPVNVFFPFLLYLASWRETKNHQLIEINYNPMYLKNNKNHL
jgi:hypothetical protein